MNLDNIMLMDKLVTKEHVLSIDMESERDAEIWGGWEEMGSDCQGFSLVLLNYSKFFVVMIAKICDYSKSN